MKTKEDTKTTAASANLAKSGKPKHRCKRLLIVCGVVVVLVGLAIAGDDHLQLPWLEEMYHRECGGKSSSTKKEQVSAEEKCLRPHIERIFGRDAEFGVEFRLCKKDGVDKRSFADLSQVDENLQGENGRYDQGSDICFIHQDVS